jgi:hypothetical protein
MNPFKRLLQRMERARVPSARPERVTPPGAGEDDGDAAAGGVFARLPRVPPQLSPGNAAAIPCDPVVTEAVAGQIPP